MKPFIIINDLVSFYTQKINSEMLSTAKIKEDQECAWRLEKQVQAHEMQKQKKRLLRATK